MWPIAKAQSSCMANLLAPLEKLKPPANQILQWEKDLQKPASGVTHFLDN